MIERRGLLSCLALRGGASVLALMLAGGAYGQAAQPETVARPPAATDPTTLAKPDTDPRAQAEEIVVTGTNIRGQAPVGQPIIQIGRAQIESTAAVSVQQLLATTAPQLNGFGSAGQTAGSYEPRLRSLGGSSSASTLVLVDGHRITPGGGVANTSDPNIIPAGAVERVEILADGASALYGSDAVAGVINIITRKKYSGFQTTGQAGFADNYRTRSADVLLGRAWDSGSMLLTYGYTYRSSLFAGNRDFVSGNQSNSGPGATGRGGANFNTYACSPATAIPAAGQAGAGLVFAYPYNGTGIANSSTTTGLCSTVRYADLLPSQEAHRVFLSVRQDLGDRVHLSADLLYSRSQNIARVARGTITNVTVFGPGSTAPGGTGQINPFFTGPPGVNRETVSYDFDDLFGAGARTKTINTNFLGNVAADIDISEAWKANFTFTIGVPKQTAQTTGTICQVCAYQALNGTSLASGAIGTNVQGNPLGTATTVTRLPLTTANAFNVFAPGAPGTSAAVLAQVLDNNPYTSSDRPITDIVGKIDGPLFALPGGDVKIAVGGEYYVLGSTVASVTTTPIGGTSSAGSYQYIRFDSRKVVSGFGEIIIPVIGEEMGVPLVRKFDIDVAGRIDHYSDLAKGNRVTKNPKIGASWQVIEGLTARASYGTSFTAPTIGATQFGVNSTIVDYFGNGNAAFSIPAGYPGAVAFGCPATGTCTITAGSGKSGIQVFGGNPNLKPQTGKTWSAGFDFRPTFFRGFHANVTYWYASYRGVITNLANLTTAANTPGLESVLVLNPTADQIAAATFGRTQTTTIGTPISFISNIVQQNFYNFKANGLDFEAGYNLRTGIGTFDIGATGELKTHFVKQLGTSPYVNALNVENTTNTFAPVRFTGRANLGWGKGPFRVDGYLNHVSGFYVLDNTLPFQGSACPPNVTTSGLGCQKVKSYDTVDAHVAYTFQTGGLLHDLQLFADASNLFDKRPPFVNSTDSITPSGSLNAFGNPIGRVVTAGFRKKW